MWSRQEGGRCTTEVLLLVCMTVLPERRCQLGQAQRPQRSRPRRAEVQRSAQHAPCRSWCLRCLNPTSSAEGAAPAGCRHAVLRCARRPAPDQLAPPAGSTVYERGHTVVLAWSESSWNLSQLVRILAQARTRAGLEGERRCCWRRPSRYRAPALCWPSPGPPILNRPHALLPPRSCAPPTAARVAAWSRCWRSRRAVPGWLRGGLGGSAVQPPPALRRGPRLHPVASAAPSLQGDKIEMEKLFKQAIPEQFRYGTKARRLVCSVWPRCCWQHCLQRWLARLGVCRSNPAGLPTPPRPTPPPAAPSPVCVPPGQPAGPRSAAHGGSH